ncbi:hypothetical protein SEPCBS119000_003310 [Sporothrix epigloea]|uniref:PLD phosphodiesterase domain-containing protein n=1 Tax=Sporothrix epigloea TaxID=1892477 RepID=A0ABP0DPE6_9PEZI
MADPHTFTRTLLAQLQTVPADVAASELPAYRYNGDPDKGHGDDAADAAADPVAQFATWCTPHTFRLGTGASQFASALLPALLTARHEILFATCFWAPSKSLSGLSEALVRLATARSSSSTSCPPLRIRIGLSSRSLLQKLLHTSSCDGYTYPEATWESQLGLPPPDVLAAGGIDLSVKSLFFLPLSVMHPKYVIVDRQRAFLPSCNVSWEPWLEDCIEVTGDAVGLLVSFHARTWGNDLPLWQDEANLSAGDGHSNGSAAVSAPCEYDIGPVDADGPGSILVRFSSTTAPVPTVILPSSHHRNPLFRPFPWQGYAPPPPTPLNLAMLQLLRTAAHRIYLQSPNLTAEAVIVEVLAALGRGVDVDIVTSEHMMVYEQILTAGTTTARCIRRLVKQYNALLSQQPREASGIGRLTIMYYKPLQAGRTGSDIEQALLPNHAPAPAMSPVSQPCPQTSASGFAVDTEQPVHSHAKLSIFDGEHTMLGSGNLDRASFFTSQELGILLHSTTFARAVQTAVDRVLEGRLKQVYPPVSLE